MDELKHKKAFTLLELIIVITILVILATIAFVSFQNYTKDSRDANRLTTINNISKGLDVFQIKTGFYPEPESKTSFTGAGDKKLHQGIISDNITNIINLSEIPLDPKEKTNYIYSTYGDGKYYQIASEAENITSFLYNTTYAENKSSIVRGNYKFDPSLPSLIVIPNSLTGSSIFDPKVCFVTNGGLNSISSNSGTCLKKEEMSLKNFDSGLVGYWDMETTFNSGGKIWIKDMSGYGNHVFGSGINVKYGTSGLINNAIEFNGEGLSQTGYYESEKMIGNIFNEGITMSVIFKKNNFFENMYQKIILIGNGVSGNNFLAGISQGDANYNFYGVIWPESNDGSLFISVITDYPKIKQWNLSTLTYNKGELKFFLNGTLIGKSKYKSTLNFLEKKNLPLRIGYGYINEYFKGTIDDVKIYNRALTDQEIAQQARIAGF